MKYRIKLIRFIYTPDITYSQYPLITLAFTSHLLIGNHHDYLLRKLLRLHRHWRCWRAGKSVPASSLLVQNSNTQAHIAKERRQLLAMSDASLSDMGITRAQAEQEARRMDLPETRLKALNKETC